MLQMFRAPLAAGTIAVVGAAAVMTAPAENADRLLAALATASTSQITLTALSNPIEQLLLSGEMAENYVFGDYYNGGNVPTPGAGEANWPSAGFDQTGGDVLNFLLYQEEHYRYVGFLENLTAEAYLPAVQQWQINVEDYISVVLSGLNLAARDLATGVWDLPSAALNAVQLAVQGQFAEALTVISDAIIGPIMAAGQSVLDAGSYVVSNVVARAGAVVAALPQILTTFAGSAIGGASVLTQQTVAIISGVVSNLSTLNFEGAWNTAVEGLLGPSGIPGTLLNLNTGAGVQTGPIVDLPDVAANFVPSFRTALQNAQWTIRGALEVTPTTATAPARRAKAATADTAPSNRKAAKRDRASRTAASRTGN